MSNCIVARAVQKLESECGLASGSTHYPSAIQDYDEIKDLGEGSFARVVMAQVRKTNKEVALKIIDLKKIEDKTSMACAEKEFDVARKLTHTRIVQTYATFKDVPTNRLVIVLEYMCHGDLERYVHNEFLAKNCILPERKIWLIFEQIADALQFMHGHRVIHRDLKPANVMLGPRHAVKVGDFGLSRMKSSLTMEVRTVCGTPYYMSPERILQQGYTYASDIWSLGCILYELATAVSPFFGERHNSYSLSNKVEKADYPPVPEDCFSEQLVQLVQYCLNADDSERPNASFVHRYSQIMRDLFKPQNTDKICE